MNVKCHLLLFVIDYFVAVSSATSSVSTSNVTAVTSPDAGNASTTEMSSGGGESSLRVVCTSCSLHVPPRVAALCVVYDIWYVLPECHKLYNA